MSIPGRFPAPSQSPNRFRCRIQRLDQAPCLRPYLDRIRCRRPCLNRFPARHPFPSPARYLIRNLCLGRCLAFVSDYGHEREQIGNGQQPDDHARGVAEQDSPTGWLQPVDQGNHHAQAGGIDEVHVAEVEFDRRDVVGSVSTTAVRSVLWRNRPNEA
jgi:hypothetical protein